MGAPPPVTARSVAAVLLVLIVVAVMVRLSIWQWGRARDSLLNYTYAAVWRIFVVLTVGG